MSTAIEITYAQAKALVELTERQQRLAVRQLAAEESADLYATPHGTSTGYRIAVDGTISEIGETLPAPD